MEKRIIAAIGTTLLTVSAVSFAQDVNRGQPVLVTPGTTQIGAELTNVAQPNAQGAQESTLTLQHLKARCAELAGDVQKPQFEVKVQCRDLRFSWRAGHTVQTTLPNNREIGAVMRVKDSELPYVGHAVVSAPTEVQCATFDLYRIETTPITVDLSCEELDAIDNIADYCAPILDRAVAVDAGLVNAIKVEGESLNLCSGLAQAL